MSPAAPQIPFWRRRVRARRSRPSCNSQKRDKTMEGFLEWQVAAGKPADVERERLESLSIMRQYLSECAW